MGKGKPRHNPKKRQNRMGSWCGAAEAIPTQNGDVIIHCEMGYDELTRYCKGNPHLCKKSATS